MDGVAAHTLGAADQLKIVQGDVSLVAIPEAQAVTGRHGTVGLYPQKDVHTNPVARGIAGIGHFSLEVALLAQAQTSNG
ncbi:hypothetical protein AR540_18130 [Pseudomonas sp. EpS/L25]|nr:hypothetical protein AR540_18130 [Pseudomonas sp. EpS/L25]